MSLFSYHLAQTSFGSGLMDALSKPDINGVKGLIHGEYMHAMTLGAPLLSPSRILFNQIAFFAQWKDESALEDFLQNHSIGKKLANGWHIRLGYLRQWGSFTGFDIPEEPFFSANTNDAVVAVTIARMKFLQIPRFIRWGRPVEKQVRDDPNTTLSLASIRFPNTVSTFSIWASQEAMTNMVAGRASAPEPKRHLNAMKERNRKNFHYEFTTLRFKPLGEFGEWKGRVKYIP